MNIKKALFATLALAIISLVFTGCETTQATPNSNELAVGPVQNMHKVIVCYRLTSNIPDVTIQFDHSGKELLLSHDTKKMSDRLVVLDLKPGNFSVSGFRKGGNQWGYLPMLTNSKLSQGTIYYAGDIHLEYLSGQKSFYITVNPKAEAALSTLKEVYGGLIDQYAFETLPMDNIHGKKVAVSIKSSSPQSLNFYY